MNNSMTKNIVLFTLRACPIGRSMGTVLREIAELFPDLNFETVYVETQVEEANHYRIKTNPTTLFVDETGGELYRLEGFHETEIVKDTIDKINYKQIDSKGLEENKETIEQFVLYLLKDGKFSPVEVTYHNRTSIKAPRITAVTLLLQATKKGYDNPFPPGTTLELVQFRDTTAIITLKLPTEDVELDMSNRMKEALQQTLSRYGIKQVEMVLQK